MIEILESTLRLSTPLLLAAMGGFLCERSGIATICLEGVMLFGAWTAACANFYFHDPYSALVLALTVGAAAMSIHAALCILAKSDQIISGIILNFLAQGLTPLLNNLFFGSATNTPSIPLQDRLGVLAIPVLSSIPGVGSLFRQGSLIYLAVLLPFILHLWVNRTRGGLRLLASGEGPEALRTAGISPSRVRFVALAVGGAMAGLGGAYLSTSHASQFTRDMTSGRGYIALTALIFGKWKPIPTFFACLLFGFTDAIQIRLQSADFFGSTIPVQFIQILPYVITLVVLVGFIGRARPPLAIGKY